MEDHLLKYTKSFTIVINRIPKKLLRKYDTSLQIKNDDISSEVKDRKKGKGDFINSCIFDTDTSDSSDDEKFEPIRVMV